MPSMTGVPIGLAIAHLTCCTAVQQFRSLPAHGESSASPSFYSLYNNHFSSARYIDLTHAISPTSPVWEGFGNMKTKATTAGAPMEGFVKTGEEFTYEKHGFVATSYDIPTDQYGTQLDPPAHWNEYGSTISDVPPTVALRPLVVINIAPKVKSNASYHATVDDVHDWESSYGTVPKGSVVFFRSDWSKKWDEFELNGLPDEFPGVTLAALKFLHQDREILFHGHEPLDTDMTETLEGEAWLMHNNYAQAEGITNLHLVPEYGCLVSIGFPKLLGGTGGYARYVGICPPDSAAGGSTIESSSGAPLPKQKYPLRRDHNGVLTPTKGAAPTSYCSSGSALGCDGNSPIWDK